MRDSDDLPVSAVERKRAADHVGIAAEAARHEGAEALVVGAGAVEAPGDAAVASAAAAGG